MSPSRYFSLNRLTCSLSTSRRPLILLRRNFQTSLPSSTATVYRSPSSQSWATKSESYASQRVHGLRLSRGSCEAMSSRSECKEAILAKIRLRSISKSLTPRKLLSCRTLRGPVPPPVEHHHRRHRDGASNRSTAGLEGLHELSPQFRVSPCSAVLVEVGLQHISNFLSPSHVWGGKSGLKTNSVARAQHLTYQRISYLFRPIQMRNEMRGYFKI
jgi:hypothetical protein